MREKGWHWLAAVLAMGMAVLTLISLLILKQRDMAFSNERMAEATSRLAVSNAATAQVQVEVAQRQAAIARAEELAAQSLYVQDKDLPASFLLGIEAFKTFDTPFTRNVLLRGAEYQPHLTRILADEGGLVFSPDGKTLVVAGCKDESCSQSTLRFWDAASGQLTRQITTPPAVVVFSPDGRTLAFGNRDGSVTLRDAATLESIGQPLRTSDTGPISNLVFSPDGRILASGSGIGSNGDGGPINFWDVASRKLLWSPPGIHFGPYSLAFSSDGKTLFYLGWTGYLAAWNVTTQTQVKQPQFQGDLSGLGNTALSAGGKLAAFAPFTPDGVQKTGVFLWDTSTGKAVRRPLVGFSNLCGESLAFSPDGRTLASGCGDGTLLLWDVKQDAYVMDPEQLTGHPLKGHAGAVSRLTFSPDGQGLASSGEDGTVILWSVIAQTPVGHQLKGPSKGIVDALVFSGDGKTLSVSHEDGALEVWDVTGHQLVGEPIKTKYGSVSNVILSPDARLLAIGHDDNMIDLWNLAGQQQVGPPLQANSRAVYPQTFSPDGRVLAASTFENTILLWDVVKGRLIGPPLVGHTDSIRGVAFSPDGKLLASGGDDKTIILWNVAAQQALGRPLLGHAASVTALAFSPDGRILASGDDAGEIILWNVAARQMTSRLMDRPPVPGIDSLVFSPDGGTLAAGTGFDSVMLWDVSTGEPIGPPLPAPGDFDLQSVAFSPDGRTLAAGGTQGLVTLWDVQPQTWIENGCQRAGRNFTQAEWRQYFPDEAYRVTCPGWPAPPDVIPAPTSPAAP